MCHFLRFHVGMRTILAGNHLGIHDSSPYGTTTGWPRPRPFLRKTATKKYVQRHRFQQITIYADNLKSGKFFPRFFFIHGIIYMEWSVLPEIFIHGFLQPIEPTCSIPALFMGIKTGEAPVNQ